MRKKRVKSFSYNSGKCRRFFLLFSFYTPVVWAMHLAVISTDLSLKSHKTISIFNPKKELEIDTPWSDVVPSSIMITPDNKGIIIAERGRVRRSYFTDKYDANPKIIIEHHCQVKHSPMVAMSQKRDGSLLIVSAVNYTNSEKKRVSEYILFCNDWSKTKKLDWPIQAISLDLYGENLAIAGHLFVKYIDLERDKSDQVFFKNNNRESWIVDIAMNAEGNAIVVAGSQGEVQWMVTSKVENIIDVSNLKQIMINDNIKKIYYPTINELLYLTDDGKAKIISMASLIENNGEEIKETVFADSLLYDKVAADLRGHISTAHWTNSIRSADQDIRRKIEVYRKAQDCCEKFILEMRALPERYDYLTELGQRESGISHLLHVVLQGNNVGVLTTDGKLRLWSLPENSSISVENNTVLTESEIVCQSKDDTLPKRKSSGSSKNGKSTVVSSLDTSDPALKKISPRLIQLFKTSPGSSKENSPISSRENSPGRSLNTSDSDIAVGGRKSSTHSLNTSDSETTVVSRKRKPSLVNSL